MLVKYKILDYTIINMAQDSITTAAGKGYLDNLKPRRHFTDQFCILIDFYRIVGRYQQPDSI